MPWYPDARRVDVQRDRGYDGRGSARPISPVRINHHTAVVNRDDLDAQARDLDAAYPHFMVGRRGNITQYQDTDFLARADLDGNPSSISIETWDGYPGGAPGYWKHGGDVPPWTAEQVAAIIALDAWILAQHPTIPLRLARDSKPGESSMGLSWHRLGIDGDFPKEWPFHGRRLGGLRYSKAYGKACAGDRRIRQVVDVIYPALASEVKGGALPSATDHPESEEDDIVEEFLFISTDAQGRKHHYGTMGDSKYVYVEDEGAYIKGREVRKREVSWWKNLANDRTVDRPRECFGEYVGPESYRPKEG